MTQPPVPTPRSTRPARPARSATARTHHGNDEDVRYLLEARAALFPIMAASRAAATHGSSPHVRSLARLALAEQGDQLAAITACLTAWGHEDLAPPTPTIAEVLEGLRGRELDHAFAVVLTDHAHDSLVRARIEMVAGASPVARPIAEAAIHKQDRRLAALERLARTLDLP